MKKTFVRVLTGALAFVYCLSAFVGCSVGEETSSSSGEKENYNPVEYVDNGESISEYSIVISQTANAAVAYGADILQTRIKQATNILGNTQRAESSCVDFTALGEESFVVQNVESDLVIAKTLKAI